MSQKPRNIAVRIFDKVFLSVPLAIGLILVICVVCLLGITTSLGQVFETKWFLLCLSFIGFMMLYCSTRRLPGLIKLYLNGPSDIDHAPGGAKEVFSCTISGKDTANCHQLLNQVFYKRGYKRNQTPRKSEGIFLYEKAKLGILGPHIIHLGLLILLIAGIVTAWSGRFYDVNIKEGQGINLKGTNARLTLEKFDIIPKSEPEIADEYASRLRINKPGSPIEWYTLKVNTPLRVDGYRFYQMRYSFDVEQLDIALFDQTSDALVDIVPLTIGERVSIPKLGIDIKVQDFIHDFGMDAEGEITARSQKLINPACLITVFSPPSSDEVVYHGWIFRNFVAPHPFGQQKPKWKFTINRIAMSNTSGIKVTWNPGEFITYFGLIILVLGSFLSCYKFYRSFIVKIDDSKGNGIIEIRLSALRTKNMFEFDKELKKIKDELALNFNS